MKINKLITAMAITMSLTLMSCSDEDKNIQQQTTAKLVSTVQVQSQSEIMSYIPADTPVLLMFVHDDKHPLPQNFKDKMSNVYSSVGNIIRIAIEESVNKTDDADKKAKMSDFMDKWLSEDGAKKLGLSLDENEFALYAVDLFPVVRMTLAKSHSVGELLDDLVVKANDKKPDTAVKKETNGATVYQFGDKEVQVMVAVKGNSIVASLAPSGEVDNLMAKLLGFEKPSKNLVQSNQYQDTLSKYNYIANSLYWINTRQLAGYFVNPEQHQSAMLDILKIKDKMLSADCKTEVLEMFDKFPRLVGGSTILEEHNIDSHMIIEMPNGLGAKLIDLAGRIPSTVSDVGMSYGFSFNVDAAKVIANEFASNIIANPYKCEKFADLNLQATTLKAQLDQPLPPFVSNFKGINLIINELDLDMSQQDPAKMVKSLKAQVLLAIDNPDALKGMAEMMMPDVQKLGLKIGGDAVNISSLIPMKGSMPIDLEQVFMAMGTETVGISLGAETDVALTKDVSATSKSELINFKVSSDLYKNIFKGISGVASQFPGNKLNLQKVMMTDMLWWESESGSVNFTDRGFEVKVDIKY